MMEQAPINKILPFSVVDGPGSRSAVFVQGCNFHCAYCHNPETQNLCSDCGLCVAGCPEHALAMVKGKVVWDESKCASCDTCIKTCPNHSSPKVKLMTAAEVYAKIKGSIPFIRGITVSGGECTLYPDFLRELFSLAKKDGLGCLMDSNGSIDLSFHEPLVDLSDGVMLDIKSWNPETHRALTGCGNSIVRKNLVYLAGHGKIEELRIVCLENEVDAEAAIEG
ncbi:MAG: YjjW family glycine radical enzyme activase, partial [Spirochaetaceae bacterium]|nr:YjjW family glycine radical enzyme activase [Spirochaetaceae bacterium]